MLIDVVSNFLQKHNISKDTPICVAVSGGVDSMTLLHLLHQLNYKITAVTIDHNLRQNSCNDALFVKNELSKLNINVQILTWSGLIKHNLEAEAREARYRLLMTFCKENNIKHLCIAHHLNDQVETFLINLTRGSALDGLCAMPEYITRDGIVILRPLLCVTKKDCIKYANLSNIQWVEDETNQDVKYKRNHLRKLISSIDDIELVEQRISRTCQSLQEAKSIIDEIITTSYGNIIGLDEGSYIINKTEFFKISPYLQRSILSKLIINIHGLSHKPRLKTIEYLLAFINKDNINKKYRIGDYLFIIKPDIIKVVLDKVSKFS